MSRLFGVFIVCLASLGCARDEFEIELTPKGDALERNFRVQRHGDVSQEKLEADVARLAKEYGRKPPFANQQQRFEGTFQGRLPNDVGGHGTFTRYDSPLGSVAMYVERFRGDDDLAGMLERRKAAIDHVVSLLIGWLETELKADARWPAFHKFLHEDFRRDLFNLSLHILMTPTAKDEKQGENVAPLAAVFQYLVEHRYVAPSELPEWARAFEDAERQDDARLLALCRRLILARLDDGKQPAPELKFLESRRQLEESLRRYLETTEDYGIARSVWREKRKTDPDAPEPDAMEVIGSVLSKNLAGITQLGGDQLSLTLNLDRPAISTNGVAANGAAQLKWIAKPLPNQDMPPQLAYAVWDEPNELAQKLIFGRTALAGEALIKYCIWYRGLTDAERTAWDDFLSSLQPGPELKDRIEAFRFPGEPAETEADSRIARPAGEAIVSGLCEKPGVESDTP